MLVGRRAALGIDTVTQHDDDQLFSRHDDQGRTGEASMAKTASGRAAHEVWPVKHPAQGAGEVEFTRVVGRRQSDRLRAQQLRHEQVSRWAGERVNGRAVLSITYCVWHNVGFAVSCRSLVVGR